MIIIKLWGGLGNQLFQYAFGYALSKERDQELSLDTSFYYNQPANVGKRNVDLNLLNILEYKKFQAKNVFKILNNRYVGFITRNLPKCSFYVSRGLKYFKEPIHKFVHKLPEDKDIYFDGYWQSSKYFSKYKKDLQEMFVPKKPVPEDVQQTKSVVESVNSVCIHMRKGDFGKGTVRKVGHLLSDDYYKNAVKYCIEKLDNPTFFVFTDDVQWASSIIGENDSVKFINDMCKSDAIMDLYLMSKCKNGIMSASTFSWWGNWLRKESGLVVVPDGHYYNEFFYEDDWIRI